jgi:ABC-type antimicrobial peptide transport system permease subunit
MMMPNLDLLKSYIGNLFANPLRSLLAILGIVIGIAAVIAVIGFGEGHRRLIEQEISKIGADIFWIQSKQLAPMINKDQQPSQSRELLKNTDLIALRHFGT